jgi:hypothetical protein
MIPSTYTSFQNLLGRDEAAMQPLLRIGLLLSKHFIFLTFLLESEKIDIGEIKLYKLNHSNIKFQQFLIFQ